MIIAQVSCPDPKLGPDMSDTGNADALMMSKDYVCVNKTLCASNIYVRYIYPVATSILQLPPHLIATPETNPSTTIHHIYNIVSEDGRICYDFNCVSPSYGNMN